MQTCLESVKSCVWVGCTELSVIFKTWNTISGIKDIRSNTWVRGYEHVFQGDKLLNSELTKCVSLCFYEQCRKCGFVSVSMISSAPSAPHTPLPPLGRTACLTASPPACLLTNPTNCRPLQQSYTRASSYQKILHYTHTRTLVIRLIHILDVGPPYTSWYNVHNPVCLNHCDVLNITNPCNKTKHSFIIFCIFEIPYEYFFSEYCYSRLSKKDEIKNSVKHFLLL